MTPAQIATNDRAIRNMAARLESVGFQGDAYELAEKLARNLVLDGYRPVERPEPIQPSTSTEEARKAAQAAVQAAVDGICACGHGGVAHPIPTACVRCVCDDYRPRKRVPA